MRYYPATDTVKSCRRCNPILPLAKSSGPRRHGDSGRSKQAVRCGLPVIRPQSDQLTSRAPCNLLGRRTVNSRQPRIRSGTNSISAVRNSSTQAKAILQGGHSESDKKRETRREQGHYSKEVPADSWESLFLPPLSSFPDCLCRRFAISGRVRSSERAIDVAPAIADH